MIHYALKCDRDHRFDSWFQSAEAFDELNARGMVACAICGSTSVEKALMAPAVATPEPSSARSPAAPANPPAEGPPPLRSPASPIETMLTALRRHVERNADYVGPQFAARARAIHLGEEPERPIYGEAKADEVKGLIEDGVPVTPLPFRPKRESN